MDGFGQNLDSSNKALCSLFHKVVRFRSRDGFFNTRYSLFALYVSVHFMPGEKMLTAAAMEFLA